MISTGALRVMDTVPAELPLALELPKSLPFEDWAAIGQRLCQGQHAINWHIGDWWAFGNHHYGERATAAAKGIFGLEFQTLANLASIARAFEPSRRREVVSFTHHAEAVGLPPEEADSLLDRAARDRLSAKDVRREVQAMKATNDPQPAVRAVPTPPPAPEPEPLPKSELLEAYGHFVEAMEALGIFRELTRREQDFLAVALEALGEAHAERRAPPDDFEIILVEQGRIACEHWYRASRITVNRWLLQLGKQRLIDARANWVKMQRDKAREPQVGPVDPKAMIVDALRPVASMAADHLRVSRYGGWRITQHPAGGWLVGTVHKTSEQLIEMAERMNFDRAAAKVEAREEGY